MDLKISPYEYNLKLVLVEFNVRGSDIPKDTCPVSNHDSEIAFFSYITVFVLWKDIVIL